MVNMPVEVARVAMTVHDVVLRAEENSVSLWFPFRERPDENGIVMMDQGS